VELVPAGELSYREAIKADGARLEGLSFWRQVARQFRPKDSDSDLRVYIFFYVPFDRILAIIKAVEGTLISLIVSEVCADVDCVWWCLMVFVAGPDAADDNEQSGK
jgi:hypothetical protein